MYEATQRNPESPCFKDLGMIELWDDRCVQVIPNTGVALQFCMAGEATA